MDAAYGTAYQFFGVGDTGREACQAIDALANIGQIDSTITNFLIPLQVCLRRKIFYLKMEMKIFREDLIFLKCHCKLSISFII